MITGGGTGGHVYPALEVARLCAERGATLHYLGSLRGQEGRICATRGIPFQGFPAEPVYSLRTPRGWKALLNLFRASGMAKTALRKLSPDAVFSTGGYSAAPIMRAAGKLQIPYVIHEQNSIPGRSNRMFARGAYRVAVTFKTSLDHFPGAKVVRTGMPIRRELRAAAGSRVQGSGSRVLVFGGSQGSKFLNDQVPPAARLLKGTGAEWQHLTGPSHFEAVSAEVERLDLGPSYRVQGFLEADAMAKAYAEATLVVARSGGSLAEVAMFGLPSVLVPLPSAAANHQYHNAREFADMGAATIQLESDLTPDSLAADVRRWLEDPAAREQAANALRAWDVPDATEQIAGLIEEAARK